MDEPRRYHLIDAIRAVAILNMVLFHLYFDVRVFTGASDDPLPLAADIWERIIGAAFILVSGVAVNFSRHGYRRGIIVALCALGITAFTYWFTPELTIWFGILHFLAFAMLLTQAAKPLLRRIPPVTGAAISFGLYALLYDLRHRTLGFFTLPLLRLTDVLFQYKWLSFLGFLSKDFSSGDYFPVLPCIFLYLFGFFLWQIIVQKERDAVFCRRIPMLSGVGRHSLLIYLVHQPLLYGLCWLIFGVAS